MQQRFEYFSFFRKHFLFSDTAFIGSSCGSTLVILFGPKKSCSYWVARLKPTYEFIMVQIQERFTITLYCQLFIFTVTTVQYFQFYNFFKDVLNFARRFLTWIVISYICTIYVFTQTACIYLSIFIILKFCNTYVHIFNWYKGFFVVFRLLS